MGPHALGKAELYLGTQGYSYKDWEGPFYPDKKASSDFLSYYATKFNAVELDSTFYGTPKPTTVSAWNRSSPPRFVFAAKLPQVITHEKGLVDAEGELYEFLEVMSTLADKLGPLLIQLPPSFTVEERDALNIFLKALPEDFRFAIEFRHRSWLKDPNLMDTLREHSVAFTLIDLHYMPQHLEVTTDFCYVRWLGERSKIQRMHETQLDKTRDLDQWAVKLSEIAQRTQRIFGFANNHYSGHSPADVRYLRAKLNVGEPEEAASEPSEMEQGTLL